MYCLPTDNFSAFCRVAENDGSAKDGTGKCQYQSLQSIGYVFRVRHIGFGFKS